MEENNYKPIKLTVPRGIKYISDWKDYDLPRGHVIVDKGVTGCGYTEFCLRNNHKVILCSPRKLLLENKFEQHQEEGNWNVLYLKNENSKDEGEDKKFEDNKPSTKNNSGYTLEKDWEVLIQNHLMKCWSNPFMEEGEIKYPKFLVTYDSLGHLLVSLKKSGENLEDYFFVVDEFQSIFLDAFFKASTEFNFVETLKDCPNVLYLSATPMLESYLRRIDEFKDLDYYKLDWSNTGMTENAKVISKRIFSISGECAKIVEKFKAGDYPTSLDKNNNPIESKEAVFYLNSVTDILRVIKKTEIKPSEVNIICSNTKKNQEKLDRLSRELKYTPKINGYKIGKVPTKKNGLSNRKFTFCTRSVYMGVDFYSDNASSYVFADPNIRCLALDISLDLPQIVGRQRNRENPFKNTIYVFYKINHKVITRQEFDGIQEQRKEESNVLLRDFNLLSNEGKAAYLKKIRDGIEVSQYSDDYVSVSSKMGIPVYNKFIELAHERSWEVSQKDYQDQITVTKAIEDKGYNLVDSDNNSSEYLRFKSDFDAYTQFCDKLEVFCKYSDNNINNKSLMSLINAYLEDPDYQKFYNYFGTSGCKALKYRRSELEAKFKTSISLSDSSSSLKTLFVVNQKYTSKEIKTILKDFYQSQGISKTPKASDILDYFEAKPILVPNKTTGKRDKGYLILSVR